MRTFSGKRSTLALAIAGVTALSGFAMVPDAKAEGFIDDSTLTGGIYYWQRERDRKDVTDGDKYKTNLSHSTGTPTSTSSPAMPPTCSVLTLLPLPPSKWAKAARAVIRTKSLFPRAIKPTMKTIPAIRAGSACIKQPQI